MKILLIHNKYKEIGGEDAVFRAEADLLRRNRHVVDELLFDNSRIRTIADRLFVGLRLIYNRVSARLVKEKIEEFDPDVIHVHNFVPLISPSVFFVAARYNIPVVVTLHNYRLICPSATLFHKKKIYEKSVRSIFPIQSIIQGVYRDSVLQTAAVAIMTAVHSILGTWKEKVDVYVTLTDFARQKFLASALSIPQNKFIIKPNFTADHGLGDIRNDYFLFVGRLTEEKGIQTLLRASHLANFRLVIIGDGPLSPQVETCVKENPNVTYLGYQDKHTVRYHMKSCKALIFPSIWYEGFPVTLVEALCSGTIVIASDLGGMAEVIRHRVNGLLFQAGNEKALASQIEDVKKNPRYLTSLSNQARLTYLEKYTPEQNYPILMGIYNSALARRGVVQNSLELVTETPTA